MNIAYKIQPDKFGSSVYTVMLGISIALPKANAPRTKRFEAIIDSGATRCMFHADIGRFIGLDIKAGSPETTQGISGSEDTWVHPIMLYIPGAPVIIHAAFTEKLPVAGLLGMNGFFEHFMVTFIQTAQVCQIDRINTGAA